MCKFWRQSSERACSVQCNSCARRQFRCTETGMPRTDFIGMRCYVRSLCTETVQLCTSFRNSVRNARQSGTICADRSSAFNSGHNECAGLSCGAPDDMCGAVAAAARTSFGTAARRAAQVCSPLPDTDSQCAFVMDRSAQKKLRRRRRRRCCHRRRRRNRRRGARSVQAKIFVSSMVNVQY